MMHFKKTIAIATVALALSACGGGGGYGGSDYVPPVVTPPPPPVVFTTFVKDQIAATADNTDPVQISDIDFSFDDQENPAAYDDQF